MDRGRCLPWAMDIPCIVCQENCPVSPKAIFTREYYSTVRGGVFHVRSTDGETLKLEGRSLEPGELATGDYYIKVVDEEGEYRWRIVENTGDSVTLTVTKPWETVLAVVGTIEIQVRLQRPYVDPNLCTGCGVCEHECPVSGKRAIRVTSENESRSPGRSMLLRRST